MPNLLFITPGFVGPGRVELTGGLISNFRLCEALSKTFGVGVMAFDDRLNAGEYTHCGLSYNVMPPPLACNRVFRHRAVRQFIESSVKAYFSTHDTPDIIMATAASIPLLSSIQPTHRCKKVVMCRGFEDFGFSAPGLRGCERVRNAWDLLRRTPGTRKAYEDADMVIVNSRYMRAVVSQHFDVRRVDVLYPPMDLNVVEIERFEAPDENTVGFVARNPGKNLKLVYDIAQRIPEMTFLVFGAASSQSYAPSNIRLMGWESDRVKMYASANIWIVPSSWPEPYGRVATEAMSLGRRVLVSARGGLPEAVGGRSECIVDTFELDEWVRRLRASISQGSAAPVLPVEDHDQTALKLFSSLLCKAS